MLAVVITANNNNNSCVYVVLPNLLNKQKTKYFTLFDPLHVY